MIRLLSVLAAVLLFSLGTPLPGQIDIITTVAGNGEASSGGDGFAATAAAIARPRDAAVDINGTIFISSGGRIRRVAPTGTIDTFATIPLPTIGLISVGSQTWTSGIALWNGSIFAAQNSSIGSRVMRVDTQGASSVFLSPGTIGFNFGQFIDLVMDNVGNLFVADSANHRVIRRSTTGAVSIYAGRTRVNAFGGDGGLATNASLNSPTGLALDEAGNLYIADTGNHRIRRVDSNTGIIVTMAGAGGPAGGFAGDGGPAADAMLNLPRGLAKDSRGNLYLSDSGNSRVRKIDAQGIITTVAGSGDRTGCFSAACYGGDDGPAISARLGQGAEGLALDSFGNLYIADSSNGRVRKVTFNAPVSQLPPPTIQSDGGVGVLNGASFERTIAPGSWVTIFGQNLAPVLAPGRIWRPEEIVNGSLPMSLEGVTVRFNGVAGYLYFIGPRQLNLLAPDNLPTGTVTVEVETPSGTARTNAEVRAVAPGLFGTAPGPTGSIYVAAVHQDGTIVGQPSLIPGSRPALAGNLISIYGTGFGPTAPLRPAGELIEPAPLAFPYKVRIDANEVPSSFGGIVGPGLYQFNIIVPSINRTTPFVGIEVEGQTTSLRMVLAAER